MRRRQLIGLCAALAICVGLALFFRRAPAPATANDAGTKFVPWHGDAGAPIAAAASDGGAPRGAGVIAGEVFDARGMPIAGASLRVLILDGSGALAGAAVARLEPAGELGVLTGPIPFPPRTPLPRPQLAAVNSDEKGRFRIGELPAGRMVVLATHPDFVDGKSDELVLAERGAGRVQIALQAGRAVKVRIVDERGPLAGAELWRGGELAGVTDGDGHLDLARLGGAVEIEARARGYAALRRTVDPALESEVELRLARAGGRVTGVVVDERGFPVFAARVALHSGAFHVEEVSDRRGEFHFEGTPEGTFELRVTHEDHPPSLPSRVASGEDARVALAAGGGLDGDVRDERTGAAIASARVTVESAGDVRSAGADKRGRFRLFGFAAGKVMLRWSAPGYVAGAKSVEVPPAEHARDVTLRDLRLQLTLGGSVSGLVLDERGAPAANLAVSAGDLHARSDGKGHFKLEPLAPGRVEVRAGNAVESVTVDGGRDSTVELRLR